MILSDKDAAMRLNSSGNLMNRLSELKSTRKNAMSLFIPAYKRGNNEREEFKQVPKVANPFQAKQEVELKEEKKESFNPFEKPAPLPENNELAVRLNQTVESVTISTTPQAPTIDQLVSNSDEQIQLNLAHNKALSLLTRSLEKLDEKIDDVSAGKLPAAITAAAKVVEGIRRERIEAKRIGGKDAEVHFHFYTPQQRTVSEYEVIDVTPPQIEQGIY